MAAFLENLVEHPVPVVEHETVVSAPRVNFESVLFLCTQTNGSGISHDGAQEKSPHVVETNMLQEEQSHVVGTNTLQEEQCPSACSDITSEGRKKGTSFRRREQLDEMEVLLGCTTRQNQKAKNRQRRRKGLPEVEYQEATFSPLTTEAQLSPQRVALAKQRRNRQNRRARNRRKERNSAKRKPTVARFSRFIQRSRNPA